MRPLLVIAAPILLAVLAACGDGEEDRISPTSTAPAPTETLSVENVPTPRPGETAGWLIYRNDEFGFEVEYPNDAQQEEGVSTSTFSLQRGSGTVITLPIEEGTNLDAKYLKVSVGEGQRGACEPDEAATRGEGEIAAVSYNGIEFKRTTSLMAASSQLWEATTYWASQGSSCVIMDFVLYSSSPGVVAGPTRPYFDKERETAIFPAIMSTFRWLE